MDDEGLGRASILLLLEGSGAYEGWSFVAHWLDAFTGDPVPFSGLIYEGPPPPWGPPIDPTMVTSKPHRAASAACGCSRQLPQALGASAVAHQRGQAQLQALFERPAAMTRHEGLTVSTEFSADTLREFIEATRGSGEPSRMVVSPLPRTRRLGD